MLKIQSNLKINGRHWGLQFADGIAYTANAVLAAKLRLKGYVVTDEAVQPETDSQPEAVQAPAITPLEITAPELSETPKPKTTKSHKRAVTADAADESGV